VRRSRLLLLALLLQGCLYSRQELESPPPLPYRFTLFPYPTYDDDEGLQLWLSTGWRRPTNRLPPPVSESIMLDARYAASGTRGASISYDRMGRTRAWRMYARLASERLNRAPYYGIGNETTEEDSLQDLDPPFYRYQLLRTTVYAVYEREVVRHVRLHAAMQARHYRARPLGPHTLYAQDIAAGVVPESGSANSAELRLGAVYDTRNEELTPSSGAFLEGMWATSFGDRRYDRYLVSARGFVPLDEFRTWILGLRQTTELATGTVPFYISYERLTTWYLEDGFGGDRSLRLQPQGRYVAPNRWVASVDLRRKIYDLPLPASPVRLWALVFADAGRVWNPGETPKLQGVHWSAGLGSRLQISKGTLFGLDIGGSDLGPSFAISTVFAF
jgi:hypothetical protein